VAGQDVIMPPDYRASRSVFDVAASEYDSARPSYPAALFDELEASAGGLAGRLVLDWGAGTGIASRQLAGRGARVVSLDIGEQMLSYARARSPAASCVLADGNRMPVRSSRADLTTFAQSWHWFDQRAACAEVARVLRPGGHWAAWWNRAKADGQAWFGEYQRLLSASCPSYTWMHLSDELMAPDWTDEAVLASGLMEPAATVVVPWTRRVTASRWITDERSKSYVIELDQDAREDLLGRLARVIAGQFADGQMVVPYITTMLVARKAG
jgi:ubiquinone/menaquinone biosynthesis C-methylase UbiE